MKAYVSIFSLVGLIFVASYSTFAADCGGKCFFESEIIADDHGYSLSQFAIYGTKRWSLLARGFAVEPDILRHGEFEFGPTFHVGIECFEIEALNTVGFTTDGSFTTGHTFNVNACENMRFTYIADPKWYFWNSRRTDELFQKIVTQDLISTRLAAVSFYADKLVVDFKDSVFLRIGPRVKILPNFFTSLFGEGGSVALTPFYDIEQNTFGGMATVTIIK